MPHKGCCGRCWCPVGQTVHGVAKPQKVYICVFIGRIMPCGGNSDVTKKNRTQPIDDLLLWSEWPGWLLQAKQQRFYRSKDLIEVIGEQRSPQSQLCDPHGTSQPIQVTGVSGHLTLFVSCCVLKAQMASSPAQLYPVCLPAS